MLQKIFITVLVSCLCLQNSFAQEKIWTKQTKISEVIAFEKSINPNAKFLTQKVSLSKEYYPQVDKYEIPNPIIVQREPLEYLPIYANYFYSQQDSVLRLVSYNWEKDVYGNFFEKQKMWKQESKKLELYNKEYERIKKVLLSQLGQPNTEDSAVRTVTSENGDYLTRSTLWETKDVHTKLNMIFASSTYRIRLTMYWKN
jgi:hypothetical protein